MKKIISLILLSCIFLCGCKSKTYYWEFEKPLTEVQKISIVYIDRNIVSAHLTPNIPAIKYLETSQYEEFYNEILTLKMTGQFGTELIYPSGYCFLIDYGNNEDYCIISSRGSCYLYYDKELDCRGAVCPCLDFDKEVFNFFI